MGNTQVTVNLPDGLLGEEGTLDAVIKDLTKQVTFKIEKSNAERDAKIASLEEKMESVFVDGKRFCKAEFEGPCLCRQSLNENPMPINQPGPVDERTQPPCPAQGDKEPTDIHQETQAREIRTTRKSKKFTPNIAAKNQAEESNAEESHHRLRGLPTHTAVWEEMDNQANLNRQDPTPEHNMSVLNCVKDSTVKDRSVQRHTKYPTPNHLCILKANYMQLMDAISISIEWVVRFLYHKEIITDIIMEDILSESRNRFTRTSKVLDIIRSQGSRTEAFDALYQATLDSQLWIAADILHPDKAPHGHRDEGEEKVEEVNPKVPVELLESKEGNDYQALTQQMESLKQNISDIENVQKILKAKADDCEASLEIVGTQVESNKTDVSSLKCYQDTMRKTAFMINLEKETELTARVETRLDQCGNIIEDSHFYDKELAFYIVPLDGVYVFNVSLCYKGDGKLRVSIGTENGDMYQVTEPFISEHWTGVTSDTRSGGHILRLTKDERVGVYVKSLYGQARVTWCLFSGCLVS